MNTFIKAVIVGDGIDPNEYHKQEFKRGDPRFVMSRSELMDFAECPSKWINGEKQNGEGDDEEDSTESTAHGSLVDCLVTDKGRFAERFAVTPQFYTNDKGEEKPWRGNAKVCEAWEADQEGKTLVKFGKMCNAEKAVARLFKDPIIAAFINCSKKQVMATAIYKDRETGLEIEVKTLLDFVPDANHPKFGKSLGDLKTCRTAEQEKFKWQAFREGYHVQAAFYYDVYMAACPTEDRQDWRLILSENVSPFEPGRRWIDSDMVELGRQRYLTALRNYCQCLKTGVWPGFDDVDGQLPNMQGWSQISHEARMLTQS